MSKVTGLALVLVCAGICWQSDRAIATPYQSGQSSGVRSARGGFMIAQSPILEYVQTQQLPNGHIRVLLQFNANIVAHPVSNGASTNYVVQFVGAAVNPSVPNLIPVNLGPIQVVNVTSIGNALNVALSMSAAVQPHVISGTANGLVIIDVPASREANVNPATPYNAAQPQPNATGSSNGPTQTKIIRLRFADVSEVVGILSGNANVTPGNVFNPQQNQIGANAPQPFNGGFSQAGQFNQVQPFQQYQTPNYSEQQALGQRISDTLAIDRRLNAIILTGTAEQIAQAEAMIRLLDVPVDSVLLDTNVIEVTESGAKSLGLDFNQTETTPLTRVFNTQAQIINNIPSQAVAGAVAIQSNIFLLVSQGRARVLAAPKILTQDGVPASILTGDSLPIRVTTPVGVGGVGAVSSQVEYINVGVNLQILPHVTGNGGVDANIYSQVSSVTGFTSSNDPQISTRQAQTKVNLQEGQALVIGGLLQQRDIRNLQKIPLLGDLPLVGALFRFYTETRQNTNLVITITPHVVPAPPTTPANAAPAPGR